MFKSRQPFTKEELIAKFADSIGSEKAKSLVEEVIKQANLGHKVIFNKEDTLELTKILKTQGGFVGILATCLASEAYHIE